MVKKRGSRYRWALFWLAPGFFVAGLLAPGHFIQGQTATVSYIGQIKPGASLAEVLLDIQPVSVSRVYHFSADPELERVYRLELPADPLKLAALRASPAFVYLEPETAVRAAEIATNDPEFTTDSSDAERQWWLEKTGVVTAWESTTGSKAVTVAVVDTGIDGKHEDLSDGRVGSGFASYCQVNDSASSQCLVHISATFGASENTDDNGHGTIVSGIIGAVANNGKGVAGINWNVRLLPVKVLGADGTGVSSDVAAGIVWATDAGADIINLSLGGTSIEGNAVLNQAIAYAYNKSVLVVAAAGNDAALSGADLDLSPVHPVCSDGKENMVLGVAAVDQNDKRALFSNFGRNCIDIAAPGVAYFNSRADQKGLVSTYYDPAQPTKNSLYVFASGTSVAAPIVSGIAALVAAKSPDLEGSALMGRLIASADNVDAVNQTACLGESCTGRLGAGRVNAEKALSTATFISNSLITDSSGRVYLIENGLKRLVSAAVFKQRGLKLGDAKVVSLSESELLPAGEPLPPLDGTLVKAAGVPTVFFVESGILRPVSLLAFRSFKFIFSQVVELAADEVSGYRLGRDLPSNDGALIKLEGVPAVYILSAGERRLLSAFTFRNLGLNFAEVTEVSAAEFEKYLLDEATPLQPPREGTLLKGDAAARIYVVEAGKLRTLSARAFLDRGYQYSQVNIVPESEVSVYKLGDDIP
ncbi:MAG: S8 family serine peptidase [Patescibacteria group bacterium]|nr:S8 family serine peptidase [Patescibacteria group bacterium]